MSRPIHSSTKNEYRKSCSQYQWSTNDDNSVEMRVQNLEVTSRLQDVMANWCHKGNLWMKFVIWIQTFTEPSGYVFPAKKHIPFFRKKSKCNSYSLILLWRHIFWEKWPIFVTLPIRGKETHVVSLDKQNNWPHRSRAVVCVPT